MTTTTQAAVYLLDILSDLDEDPIRLTQADFDQLISAGQGVARKQEGTRATEEATVDFATLESLTEDGQFFFNGAEIAEEEAAYYCELGLREAIRLALAQYEARQG